MANKTTKDSGVTIDTHNKVDIETVELLIKTNTKTILEHPELALEIPPLMIHSSPGIVSLLFLSKFPRKLEMNSKTQNWQKSNQLI